MEVLLERVDTEPITDRLPAVNVSGRKCGFEDCGKPAAPLCWCKEQECRIPLCADHANMNDGPRCPKHKKGGA